MKLAGHVACMGMDAYSILVDRPEGKRQFASLRCRWDGNIKMDFQEIE
jgi:hypothetical protein